MTSLLRGRYELLEVVGRGGQGTVMRARDVIHERPVALKVREVHGNDHRATLLQEARVLLSVRPHTNLPLLRDDFLEGERYYLVMDWIDGRNLRQIVEGEGTP